MPPRRSSTAITDTGPAKGPPGRKLAPRMVTAEYVAALEHYAKLLFNGGLAPKGTNRPERVAALIEIGRDVGLPATMAVSWIAIINGRPSIWGDAAMALIRSSGLMETCRDWYEGEPGMLEYTACFAIKRVGCEERTARFSMGEAARANLIGKPGPWTEYPERQLMWRAKGFACRDEFQDVLCGLIFQEEARDMPRVVVAEDAEPAPTPAVVVVTQVPPPPAIEPARSEGVHALPPGPPPTPVVVVEVKETPAADPKSKPITDAQLAELTKLRDMGITAKAWSKDNPAHDGPIKSWWAGWLLPYRVASAKLLTAGQADELIEAIGAVVDPFGYPPAKPGTPT